MQTQMVSQSISSSTWSHSFNPVSVMGLSTLATNTFGEGNVDGECHFSWGSGHYPAYTQGSTVGWQTSSGVRPVRRVRGSAG